MKILSVQVFALMITTMAVMVYAASLGDHNPKHLLQQIKNHAKNTEKHVPLDKLVRRTTRENKVCEDQFFCWAEMILKEIESDLLKNGSLIKLTRSVHVYNTQVKNSSCSLDTNDRYALGSFLEDIVSCVEHALIN